MNDTIFIIEYQSTAGLWLTACDLDGGELTYNDFDQAMGEARLRLAQVADGGLRVRRFEATRVYPVE